MFQSLNFESLRGNFIAGTTTSFILIPQSMAYATVAGLPPHHGLYASILPLVAYALVGRSRQLAVGTGALDSLLVGTAIAGLGSLAEGNEAGWAAVLAIEVAAIQFLLGILRAGFLTNFLAQPVLAGFTSAAAILIGFGQLHKLLGYPGKPGTTIIAIGSLLVESFGKIHAFSAVLGVAGIAGLMAMKRYVKQIPGALAVVVLGIPLSMLAGLEARGIQIVGFIPSGLPRPALPDFTMAGAVQLLPMALTIALISYLVMISIARSFADRKGYEIDGNRELIGAAAANLAAGLSQAYPIASSFSRSAVNANAGATSRYAGIVTAAWVVLTLLLLTSFLSYLPVTLLAAIIMQSVLGLVDLKAFRRLLRLKTDDVYLFVAAFLATLLFGVEIGILAGVGVSLAFFLYGTTRPHTAVLGRVPGTRHFRNVKNYPEVEIVPGLSILRFDAEFYFANASFFKELIADLERDPGLRRIVIDASSLIRIDSSAEAVLDAIAARLRSKKIGLAFAAVKMPVLRVLQASGLYERIGAENFFWDVDEAVAAYQKAEARP